MRPTIVWTVTGLVALLLNISPACAGPPFITDDPEPVDLGHWEVYGFAAGSHVAGDTGGTLAGVEVNYGAAPNLQLHLIAPLAFDAPRGGTTQIGSGDLELGTKYRFITPRKGDWFPQVGIFPLIELPSGNAAQGLGTGRVHVFLPVWLQQDAGQWTSYAGGGYWINPGAGNRDYWFAGWLLQRQVSTRLAIGGEIFHQTANRIGGNDASGFNLGAIYDFNEHYHLLLSAGRGLQNVTTTNEFSWYLGLQKTF